MAPHAHVDCSPRDVALLLPKFDNPDADIRFMSLVDLSHMLPSPSAMLLLKDHNMSALMVEAMAKTLNDTNGDVQSQALKCLGPLANQVPPEYLPFMLERLSTLETDKSADASIAATAIRTVLVSLAHPIAGLQTSRAALDAYSAVSKIISPRFLGRNPSIKKSARPTNELFGSLANLSVTHPATADAIDVVNEIIRYFGPLLNDSDIRAFYEKLSDVVASPRTSPVAKKKAIAGIALLAPYFSDSLLSTIVSQLIESFRQVHTTAAHRKLLILTVGALARAINRRFGPYLQTIAPFVLAALSQAELEQTHEQFSEAGSVDPAGEEVKEAALVTLDDLLSTCNDGMRGFTNDAIDASLRYLSYDLAVVPNGEEDDASEGDDDGFQVDDEDFEEEEQISDEDDSSWKIRRCAAKMLQVLITTRSEDLMKSGLLYEKIAPALIRRFGEREETVKLEVLSAMTSLIRITRESTTYDVFDSSTASQVNGTRSRKRRRGGSDASMTDASADANGALSPGDTPSPTSGPRADLVRLGPDLIEATIKILKQPSLTTKQGAVILLNEYVRVRHGALQQDLGQIIDPIINVINAMSQNTHSSSTAVATAGTSFASGNTVSIEALQFITALCETHSSRVLTHHHRRMVQAVIASCSNRSLSVTLEAVTASDSLIKTLTPPRASSVDDSARGFVEQIFQAMITKSTAKDTDLEVRQKAILVIGGALSRNMASPKLLSVDLRQEGLALLQDRLRNETTRIASVSAINSLGASIKDANDIDVALLQSIASELTLHLRKSDRKLHAASLMALHTLTNNAATLQALSNDNIRQIATQLTFIMDPTQSTHLSAALGIASALLRRDAETVMTPDFIKVLSRIIMTPLPPPTLQAFLNLVETIGRQHVGGPLMQALLQDVGVSGDPSVVGIAIGTLIASGHGSVELIEDLRRELQGDGDDVRRCLTITIIGEVARRTGSAGPIKPSDFVEKLALGYANPVARAAALALGRAAIGDLPTYLPIILTNMKTAGPSQGLMLHSIKVILQHGRPVHAALAPYVDEIWTNVLSLSGSDDTKAIGAECIGRLVALEPSRLLPVLQDYLNGSAPVVRGTVIQAVRFALGDAGESFDAAVKPALIQMLATMLRDPGVDNRRLALTTVNSALRNQPQLMLSHLSELLPLVYGAAEVDPQLIHEVQMGPFKHKVDDGLEMRKGAYETLHSLLDTAGPSRLGPRLWDRIIAGLRDEHEIKIFCGLMISKLITADPAGTGAHLDALAPAFRATLSTKLKDNAVKQEIEKAHAANRDVLRCTLRLVQALPTLGTRATPGAVTSAPSGAGHEWNSYMDWVVKDYGHQLHEVETQLRRQG